jgi:hypothetical protein
VESLGTRVSAGSLLNGEAGSGAKGRVAALDPPGWRGGPKSLGTWTHGSTGALPKLGCGFQYRGGTW